MLRSVSPLAPSRSRHQGRTMLLPQGAPFGGRSAGSSPGGVLLGRHSEGETLDRLVDAVRSGESRSLVVRGEAGVGKSALLDHVARRASGCRVARAVGVRSERRVPVAAPPPPSGPQFSCAPPGSLPPPGR